MPVKIRHGKFLPGEGLIVSSDQYPNFYNASLVDEGVDCIEWYPSLDDLMADDWEFIK